MESDQTEIPVDIETAKTADIPTLTLEVLDAVEIGLMGLPKDNSTVTHDFIPGFYCRTIFMPAGSVIVSKIHMTEHPYVVTKGRVNVWVEGVGVKEIKAPHSGITTPGTRRLLAVIEDTVWTTFHPTTKTDVDEIEKDIIFEHKEHRAGLVQPTAEEFAKAKEAALCHGSELA